MHAHPLSPNARAPTTCCSAHAQLASAELGPEGGIHRASSAQSVHVPILASLSIHNNFFFFRVHLTNFGAGRRSCVGEVSFRLTRSPEETVSGCGRCGWEHFCAQGARKFRRIHESVLHTSLWCWCMCVCVCVCVCVSGVPRSRKA